MGNWEGGGYLGFLVGFLSIGSIGSRSKVIRVVSFFRKENSYNLHFIKWKFYHMHIYGVKP